MPARTRVTLLLAAAVVECGGCNGQASDPSDPLVSVRTLAYVSNECREGAHGVDARQALRILRAAEAPVTVRERPTLHEPMPSGVCNVLGQGRFGPASLLSGVFSRLGVRPDASGVVFEETDAFALLPVTPVPADESGIFFVAADGSGLRRLGDASRQAPFAVAAGPTIIVFEGFAFSPDGARVVFTDRGPDAVGAEAIQIVILHLATQTRTQLTRLPPISRPRPPFPSTCCPRFLDDETIGFLSFSNPDELNPEGAATFFTVRTDATDLKAFPPPVAVPGSQVVPIFSITGKRPSAALFVLPGMPENDLGLGSNIVEVFFRDRDNLLQLTTFRRVDTNEPLLSLDHARVFLVASGDPFGTNPSENCQIFSMDPTGTDLQQLTQFEEGAPSANGCVFRAPPGCAVGFLGQDANTQSVVFYSSCDPIGTNPNGGQIFAMRPDGTGLRQLTHTRGSTTDPDGTLVVELPGPFAYSASPR